MRKRTRQHRAAALALVPARTALYPGYTCIHATFHVAQYGEDQELYEGTDAPQTPYLMLESTPCEGADADAWEIPIPYDQLEDVIRVLMEARKLQPPAPVWRKTADGWEPIERGP